MRAGQLPEEIARQAAEFCRDEYFDSLVYKALAEREVDPKRRRVLETLARQEWEHYEFWKEIAGDCGEVKVSRARISLLAASYKLLGPAFTLKLLERGEEETIKRYREILDRLPEHLRPRLEAIIAEEEEHEDKLMEEIEDARAKYLGYMALGLADAVVEITGVHAGFLGATAKTLVAGVAGLVVGFSAALSMAGAAYLQAKHGGEESPTTSALVTGLSYIFSVIVLALPYFLTENMALAFAVSVAAAVALTSTFTYYSVVIQGKPLARELAESVGLLLGTALGSFLFGEFLGRVTGIQGLLG